MSCNDTAVPRLMGVLMDPTRSKSNGANDSERKFIGQILWLSLVGGMASFTRVSDMRIVFKDAIGFWL